MEKYGAIKHFSRQYDHKGRSKGHAFVEYHELESAQKAVEETGRANVLGRKLVMNYKIATKKVLEDRDCWFCFDNPNIEKHLIFYESKSFYLALPKGPIADEHVLIVPKKHLAHSVQLNEEEEKELKEIQDKVIATMGKDNSFDYILFERNMSFSFQKASHMNIQVIFFKSQS
mmetsp:Transcript_41033/g.39548  ORF Transcript_41033/g.39548 Transcript_41033/m.39548 type:complete len:173 (+) Transcript_41033:149-667(+)